MSRIETNLTIKISFDGEKQESTALLHLSQGEASIITRFNYQGYEEFSTLLYEKGFEQLAAVIANPPEIEIPEDIEQEAKKTATKRGIKMVKGPYTLEQNGRQRKLMMFDPFDVQETCMKNKDFKFDDLDTARSIAKQLVAVDSNAIRILGKGKKVAAVVDMSDEPEGNAEEEETETSTD